MKFKKVGMRTLDVTRTFPGCLEYIRCPRAHCELNASKYNQFNQYKRTYRNYFVKNV